MYYSFYYVRKYLQDKKVLDVGCGNGEYLQYFSRSSIGIDINHRGLEECRGKNFNVRYMDINKGLKFDKEYFDAVFCSHVLEHANIKSVKFY